MSNSSADVKPSRVTSRFGEHSTALDVVRGIDLGGRNAIITGGASGLGIETVRALAGAGANVTIAARNLEVAAAVAEQINREIGAVRISFSALELGDLASVRDFVERWGDKPLSLLINNAGVMMCPLGRTKDGFEMQFGTNHLGHFLLATLLTPAWERGAPARLISLSSAAHLASAIDFNDPNYFERQYHPFLAYGQSKTANALFAVEYDRRYRERGISAFSVMPGIIETKLGRHLTPELTLELGLVDKTGRPKDNIRRKNAAQGASTTVWAATAGELDGKGGLYLEDCAEALPFSTDLPRGKGVMAHALDAVAAQRLWEVSEQLVGLAV